MKLFISWSGSKSHEVAKLFNELIPEIIQYVKPWISSEDIESGSIWDNAIQDNLNTTNLGLICLTQENKEKPWILFEAGSLSKGLEASRVFTFLIDLKSDDLLKNPLTKFNHTENNKESIYKLIKTINNNLGETTLDEKRLLKMFNRVYPELEKGIKDVLKKKQEEKPTASTKEEAVLSEILEAVRAMSRKVDNLNVKPLLSLTPVQTVQALGRDARLQSNDEVYQTLFASDAWQLLKERSLETAPLPLNPYFGVETKPDLGKKIHFGTKKGRKDL